MGYAGGTIAQVLAKLQACLDRPDQAAFKKTNVRLTATHLFGEAIVPAGTALTRADLDRLDTTRPVMVENADGHKFWMNSRAIENARIDEKTPDQPGGMIGRDADRKPNGTTDPAALRQRIAALDEFKKYGRGLIAVTSVKIYCDGVMEYPAHTAAMLKPYNVNTGTLDKPNWRPGTNRGPDPSCSDARAG